MAKPRRLISRLIQVGITPETPPAAGKHVVLTNQLILIGGAVSLFFAPLNLALGHPSRTSYAILQFVMAFITGLPLLLNARKKYWLAATSFGLICMAILTAGTIILGLSGGPQIYLNLFVVIPFLVYPRRHLKTAVVMSVLALVTVVLLIALRGDVPIVGKPFSPSNTLISNISSLAGFTVMLLALGYYTSKTTQRAEDEVDHQKQLAENLLLNILPAEIAQRLKKDQGAIAEEFNEVTVLFADIAEFTILSDKLRPEELVVFLNRVFSELDHLTDKHGLEKIKTIGDAYMVASGLPLRRKDHAPAMAEFALEMVQTIARIKSPDGQPLQMRIGMSSGPAVAGVIGERKFSYDLWGDTVNTASRMESHGKNGAIQVTRPTYELLRDRYELAERGWIDVKGKGRLETWWLVGGKGNPSEGPGL